MNAVSVAKSAAEKRLILSDPKDAVQKIHDRREAEELKRRKRLMEQQKGPEEEVQK